MQGLNPAPASFDYAYTSVPNRDTTKAIARIPNEAEDHNTRGITYSENGDQDRAIAEFSRAIALKPDFAEAYNNRGVAYYKKGEYDLAIQDLNMAIQLSPDDANAYSNRGVAYGEKGEYERAIEDCNMAIQLKPRFVEAYYNRGITYSDRDDFDRALQDYTRAIKLKPEFVDAYCNRGVAYGEKGEYERAIEDFNTTIQLKPNDADAYCNRGVAYGEKGEYERAIEDFNTTIQLKPNDADAYFNRGEAWLHLEEWDKARTDLTTARDKGSDIIAAFRNDYKNVEAYEQRNRVKLPEDIAAMLTPQGVAKTGLDEFLGNYARAWEGLEKALQQKEISIHADLDNQVPKDIEKILQKVRAEAEEERRLDQELDALPEAAYEDADRFLKTINGFVPLPDIMPLDNGEICLEWREGQKIFTLSFGGDGHIVFAGIFGAEHPRFHRDVPQARGILTFSMPHLIAVIGMITGLYLHDDY